MKAYRFTVPANSTLTQTLRFLYGVAGRHPKRLLTNSHIDQLDALAALIHIRQLAWAIFGPPGQRTATKPTTGPTDRRKARRTHPNAQGEPMPASFDPNNPYAAEVINVLRRLTYKGAPILPVTRTPGPLTEVVKLCNQAFRSGLAEGHDRVASCQKKEREAAQ